MNDIESGPIESVLFDQSDAIMSALVFRDIGGSQTSGTLALLIGQTLLFAGRLFHTLHTHTWPFFKKERKTDWGDR